MDAERIAEIHAGAHTGALTGPLTVLDLVAHIDKLTSEVDRLAADRNVAQVKHAAIRSYHDQLVDQLSELISEGDEAEYSNPEGAVESILVDVFTAYVHQRDAAVAHIERLHDNPVARRMKQQRDHARDIAVALEQQLAAVRELHREWRIYDECGHDHTYDKDGNVPDGVVRVEEVGLTCADGYLYSICWTCCTDGVDGYQREECLSHDHGKGKPVCRTAELIDGGGQ